MSTSLLAQKNISFMEHSQEKINVNIKFDKEPFTVENGKLKFANKDFFMDENKPSYPILPEKIFYFAIPPYSKVSLMKVNSEIQFVENFELSINPRIRISNDSAITYEDAPLFENFNLMNIYPEVEFEIIGYTWIRDYYCVAVKIFPYRYIIENSRLIELTSLQIQLNINDVKPYQQSDHSRGDFDKQLEQIISNYALAANFRSEKKIKDDITSSDSWIDYTKEYIKFLIAKDAIYRISYNDLIDYGLNPSLINPKTFKLYVKGNEHEIYVKGEDDFNFDTTDFIEFYSERNYDSTNYRQIGSLGQDYMNFMDRYSDTAVVWLSWGGTNGKRCVIQNSVLPASTDTLASHLVRMHFEQDKRLWYYDATSPRVQLPFWQENKVWTWLVLGSTGSQSISFNARDAVPNTPVKVLVRLISNAANISTNAHKNGVSINSTSPQDTITYNYKQTVNFSSTQSSNLLVNGINRLRIFGIPTSAAFHQSLIDWVDIEYTRMNKSVNDSILLIVPENVLHGLKVIKVENINVQAQDLVVYKIKPNIKRVENFTLSSGPSKILTFSDTSQRGDVYLIIKNEFVQKPLFSGKKYFVNLRSSSRGADYILLTNKRLSSSATNYKNFISMHYGLRTELVFVEDIFDEFSFGMTRAEAVRDFLFNASIYWSSPKPSYLTLAGDANYDYRDVIEPVPLPRKKNLVTSYGNPVSDVWYVTWDTSNVNLPQMFVGRIPVNNDNEFNNYLLKHRRFVGKPFNVWNKVYMFFSGGDVSKPFELAQIKAANEDILQNIVKPSPIGGQGKHFYKTISPPTNFGPYSQEEIRNTLDEGAMFISYIGHSGTRVWDNGVTEVEHIQNKYSDRFPLISDFGCSTGKFAEPDIDAFGELFISQSPNGQAIAYLGNSSWGYLSTSLRFPKYFYSQLLQDSIKIIGRAHFLGKVKQFVETGNTVVNRVFNYCNLLFGDPIISLRIPDKPNLSINNSSISLIGDSPRDTDDSIKIKIIIRNLGLVPNSEMFVDINDEFQDSIVYSKREIINIPQFETQLIVSIPIRGLVGRHSIKIHLDKDNLINELDESDNTATFNIDVYSTTLLSLENEKYYSIFKGKLRILNPVIKSQTGLSSLKLSISQDKNFTAPIEYNRDFDTLFTAIEIPSLLDGKRYWWRMKLNTSGSDWSQSYSFLNSSRSFSWFIDKSFEHQDIEYIKTRFDSSLGGWVLSEQNIGLKITSAGQSAGSFASMQYNAVESLPNTYFWGIATALIDTLTYKPFSFRYFLYPNPPSGDSLTSYINSLPKGTMIAMAICDDGAQSVLGYSGGTPVRNAIKSLGSLYIDSVRYRESWAILGKKGASIGSVPEVYKKLFEGPAVIDVSKLVKNDSGSIIFPLTGNSIKWRDMKIDLSKPEGTEIEFYPIGISTIGRTDTLQKINFISDSASLAFIDSKLYPRIKLLLNVTANSRKESPLIKNIGINYKAPPELGLNYQTVSLSRDTIYQGDSLNVKFFLQNLGDSDADSVNVQVKLIKNDNSKILLIDTLVLKLKSLERFNLTHLYRNYLVDGKGSMFFEIEIDPNNKIIELYKSNNSFRIPFYVRADTNVTSVSSLTVKVLYDGKNIEDGDFVSDNPHLNIEFLYPVWFAAHDTTSIQFFLNGRKIENSALYILHDTSKRKIIFQYQPHLSDGEYTFRIFGKNSLGHLESTPGYEKYFKVSGQLHVNQLFNYPNPFKNETYFTFNLTQIPDELRIKIYTVSGRLIKEIVRTSSELSTNFNRVHWDGRDEDGDLIGNGVYLYKVIAKRSGKSLEVLQKLAVVR